MALALTRLGKPLSRFELVISIVLIAILVALGARKMLLLAAYAERQFLESTVININTALRYRAGLLQLRGKRQQLAGMQGMNPLSLVMSEPVYDDEGSLAPADLLESYSRSQATYMPSRYLGELNAPNLDELDGGYWYFDGIQRVLVYLINNTEFFISELAGPNRIRYKVIVKFKDNDNDGRYDPEIDDFNGIEMKNLENYQWAL